MREETHEELVMVAPIEFDGKPVGGKMSMAVYILYFWPGRTFFFRRLDWGYAHFIDIGMSDERWMCTIGNTCY